MGEVKKGEALRAIIIGAAPCDSLEYIAPYYSAQDCIICADGGRRTAERAGLRPDWYVGDGDSGGSAEDVTGMVLPTEKDFTDLEAAVYQALRMGYKKLLLCGCSGGRADHYLANLFLLERIAEAGAEAMILDECNEIRWICAGDWQIENQPPYRYMGIISAERVMEGVTLRGVKYPLTNHTVRRTETLTVSNEILRGEKARIHIEKGCGFLIRSERM